jgi:UDP-glucose 4-epimerase
VRTALVTGAAGFIGSHLAERLAESDYRIVAVDRLLWGEQRVEHLLRGGAAVLERGDIRDEALMARVASLGPFETVYHLAALHFIPYCAAHPVETLSVNVLGTQVLLEALRALPARRFVFVSTGDVYASKDSPHQETDPLEPLSTYGLSKAFGEDLISAAARQMPNTSFVIARLFNAFGSRETNPHVIPSIIAQLKQGDRLRLGNVWPRRDYVYVRDVVDALFRLGGSGGSERLECFNIGSGSAYSVEDVINTLEAILHVRVEVQADGERIRAAERAHLQADVAKLERATGWRPRHSLQDGLRELCTQEGLLARP